jgi:uncharacterized pyridoxamine 5'-phosphate oxidase family protein
MRTDEVDEVLAEPLSQELLARDVARLAFVAADGTPRVLPIAIFWNGSEIVMCTSTNARKLTALRRNPAVALTIDTEVHPPDVLLLRGEAELDPVDGIPEEYLQMSGTYTMTPEQREVFEREIQTLYADGMVRIVVRPRWARLIDFEHTLPESIQELMDRRSARQNTDTSGDEN